VRNIEIGEVVKHMLDGYGIGIVLVPPCEVGKIGDGKVVEVLTQSGKIAKWFTDLVQKT
jgi:uncharacterized protein YwbE